MLSLLFYFLILKAYSELILKFVIRKTNQTMKITLNRQILTTGLFAFIFTLVAFSSNAQAQLSETKSTASSGTAGLKNEEPKWSPRLISLNSRVHRTPDAEAIRAIKKRTKTYQAETSETNRIAGIQSPTIGTNFEANWTLNSTPPDNSMAISNGGQIVTCNNDGIEYYTQTGTFRGFFNWNNFFNDPTLNSSIYDPVVIYDSDADRFVMVVLHGFTFATSKVLLCYSKSNDPFTNGWWVYQLNGNVLNNNCWFDFPVIGITSSEVIVTGNLFNNSNQFNQAVILQIDKAPGYLGNNISWTAWNNINCSPFTLVPASSGKQGNVGPGIYLVSTNAGGGNTMRLFHITNTRLANPQLLSYTVSVPTYAPTSDASQPGTMNLLDNGDCRMQDAFFLDGFVHYTFHTDIGNNWNGIRYGRILVANQSHQSADFGFSGVADCTYPALASVSTDPNNQSVVIAFTRVSSSIFAELRVVSVNNNMQFSTSTLVKAGNAFVDILSSNDERWGDYTGAARKYNSTTPSVWVAGCYGTNIPGQRNNTFSTWVAEVNGGTTTLGISAEVIEKGKTNVFPNPAFDYFNLEFSLKERVELQVLLTDVNGKLIKLLFKDSPMPGDYRFSFHKGDLKPGIYFLSLQGDQKNLHHEKIIIEP